MQLKAAPCLDNIETSQKRKTSQKRSNIKASTAKKQKKLYSTLRQEREENAENNSKAIIESMEYYKRLTDENAGLLIYHDSLLQDRAEKMLECGTYLETHQDGEHTALTSANFCRQRICPSCQRRRSLKTSAEVSRIVDELKDYDWLHVVLTVENCSGEELNATIDKLNKCSSELLRDKRVKQGWKGAARFLEVTYNNHGNISLCCDSEDAEPLYLTRKYWHPHLHIIVPVLPSYFTSRYYISHDELVKMWSQKCDSNIPLSCHVGKITDGGGIAEVAKYCVKPLDLSVTGHERVNVLEVLYGALHGRRTVQTYGVFREAARMLHIDLNSDDFKFDSGIIHRYNYNRSTRHYCYSDSIDLEVN